MKTRIQAEARMREKKTAPPKARILVIDDDQMIVNALVRVLSHEGYGIQAASSGEAGLALLNKDKADLVILDVSMPGMSGIDVCRRIKARSRWTPILFLSAREQIADRRFVVAAPRARYVRSGRTLLTVFCCMAFSTMGLNRSPSRLTIAIPKRSKYCTSAPSKSLGTEAAERKSFEDATRKPLPSSCLIPVRVACGVKRTTAPRRGAIPDGSRIARRDNRLAINPSQFCSEVFCQR